MGTAGPPGSRSGSWCHLPGASGEQRRNTTLLSSNFDMRWLGPVDIVFNTVAGLGLSCFGKAAREPGRALPTGHNWGGSVAIAKANTLWEKQSSEPRPA